MSKQKRKISITKKGATAAILLLFAVVIIGWLPSKLIVSFSSSLDHRVFLKTTVPEKIERGAYLLFENKQWQEYLQKSLETPDAAIKKVACLPGDKLERKKNDFFCNDKQLNVALETTSTGKKLPQFSFNGVIPAGKYFMVGTDERSFDSRYIGFIDKKEFICAGLPIW